MSRQGQFAQVSMDSVQGTLGRRTHLIQKYVSSPELGPQAINEGDETGGIPIMCIVDNSACGCCCFECPCTLYQFIPNGMYTLGQTFGEKTGIIEPGLQCCFCHCMDYKKIAVMISKNTIRFQCPIENVPTKDNVMVSLDVGINFHIGRCEYKPAQSEDEEIQQKKQQENDVEKFFYNFGPNRLEELLQQECEEGIRNFVKTTKAANVRDIKTELTHSLKQDLETKFIEYGVVIEQVNIMNVILPKDMRISLMATTNYDVYLQKQVKEQTYKMLKIDNYEKKQLLQLVRNNQQVIFKLQHEFDVEEINLLNEEIVQETKKIKREINAMKAQSVKVIEAENQKALAEARAKSEATAILKKAEAYRDAHHIATETKVQIIRSEAEARLSVAENKCQALSKEADAEMANSNNMEGMRRHTEKLKMADSLKAISESGHMIISGKNGQDVLNFYNETLDQVANR